MWMAKRCSPQPRCSPRSAGDKSKAVKALKAVKKSQWKKTRKPRYSTSFHRPKTLVRSRDPKYPRVRYGRGVDWDAGVQAWARQCVGHWQGVDEWKRRIVRSFARTGSNRAQAEAYGSMAFAAVPNTCCKGRNPLLKC